MKRLLLLLVAVGVLGAAFMASTANAAPADSSGRRRLIPWTVQGATPLGKVPAKPSPAGIRFTAVSAPTASTSTTEPPVGTAVAGVATVVVTLVPRARIAVDVAIPVVLALSRILEEPELAWLTIALLVVDLGARWVRGRARSRDSASTPPPVTPEPAEAPSTR